MKLTHIYQALSLVTSSLSALTTATPTSLTDPASTCYTSFSSSLSNATRSIPWGTPSFLLPNGILCCDSLTQIRASIDDIDTQLLSLLAQRAAYVREATRFKATLDTVDVPSRDQEVIEDAVVKANETRPRLPEVIARSVFEAIINGSVPFEECVWTSEKDKFIELRNIIACNLPNRIKMGEDVMQAYASSSFLRPKIHVKDHACHFEDYQIDYI